MLCCALPLCSNGSALCLTGWLDERLVAGIRFTAIRIGAADGGALLGPLVVDPAVKGKGYGKALVGEGLVRAKNEGFGLVLLVGDVPYYGRFGFSAVTPGQIRDVARTYLAPERRTVQVVEPGRAAPAAPTGGAP